MTTILALVMLMPIMMTNYHVTDSDLNFYNDEEVGSNDDDDDDDNYDTDSDLNVHNADDKVVGSDNFDNYHDSDFELNFDSVDGEEVGSDDDDEIMVMLTIMTLISIMKM